MSVSLILGLSAYRVSFNTLPYSHALLLFVTHHYCPELFIYSLLQLIWTNFQETEITLLLVQYLGQREIAVGYLEE